MAVAFLLGSGISDAGGMPGVLELTAQVLGGGNVVRYAGTYHVMDDSSILPDRLEADDVLLDFVRTLTARLRLRVVTDGVSGGTVFKRRPDRTTDPRTHPRHLPQHPQRTPPHA